MKTRVLSAARRLLIWSLFVSGLCGAAVQAADESTQPRWYRGNLHTHSLWSDGNDFPEMIARWYREHGYQFLAISDHNILSRGERWMDLSEIQRRGEIEGLARYRTEFGDEWVQTREVDGRTQVRLKTLEEFRPLLEAPEEFLLIEGEEITDSYESLPIHLNASNLAQLIRPQGGDSVRATIANNLQAVARQSAETGREILVHLNHPNFGFAITYQDLAAVTEEKFFEVYNGHPDVHHLGDAEHPGLERMWDLANAIRLAELNAAPLYGLATDDAHQYFGTRGASTGRGWVMVRSAELSADALIRALYAGDFYASSGVTLADVDWEAETRELHVTVEPTDDATYETAFVGTLRSAIQREPSADDAADLGGTLDLTQVGQTLQVSQGTSAVYRCTGEELYVRCVVTANHPPENPSFPEQRAQAWTQPVGWEAVLDAAPIRPQ